MSDSKMREAFESRFPIPDGVAWKESGNYGAVSRGQRVLLSASSYRAMWEAWQAAQAEAVPAAIMDSRCTYYSFAGSVCNKCGRIHDGGKSVPVVGEVVGYVSDAVHQLGDAFSSVQITKHSSPYADTPVYLAPAHSISAADLDWMLDTAKAYGEQMCKSHDLHEVERIRTAIAAPQNEC